MPLRYSNTFFRGCVEYAAWLWDTSWSLRPPVFLRWIAAKIATWCSFPTTSFWHALSVSDRTTVGFWIRHETDRVANARDSASIEVHITGGDWNADAVYNPLSSQGEFRLLKIQPASDPDAPLVLEICNAPLDCEIPYTALSYTWGDPIAQDLVNLSNVYVRAPFSAIQALRSLRTHSAFDYVWCDALCINQANIEEKGQQVGRMFDIFSRASEVTVFLGPHEVQLNQQEAIWGLATIDYLINGKDDMNQPPWETPDRECVKTGLRRILSKPWFHRYWTIQELVVAKRVRMMLGDQAITWTNNSVGLERAIQRIQYAEISPQWEISEMPDLRDLLDLISLQYMQCSRHRPRRERNTLLEVLHQIKKSGRQSTDPRDQVYALLSLVDPDDMAGIIPDYSLSMRELFDQLFARIKLPLD